MIWKTSDCDVYLLGKVLRMKKIIYIAVAFFAFGMTSCDKQDIQPNGNNPSQEPVWRSSSADHFDEGGGSEGGGITDPNTDPDGDEKKKPI